MATTDERDSNSVSGATDVVAENGDDIVVVSSSAGPRQPTSRSHRTALVAIVSGLAAVVAIVLGVTLATRSDGVDGTSARLRVAPRASAPPSTAHATVPRRAAAAAGPTPTTRVRATAAPASHPPVLVTTPSVAAPVRPRSPAPSRGTDVAAVMPRPSSGAPAVVVTTVPPTKQYGLSALTWSAPASLTVASGKTALLAVTAHNPTDGIVTLPHPLSCTPRLDHAEMCSEVVQRIGAGRSAAAQYTIDATGIAPGDYTLRIEGVLTVAVTVT